MSRSLGLLLGFAADRAFGDPRRYHPVAGFGSIAAATERRLYADDKARGSVYTALLVGEATLVGVGVARATRGRPIAGTAVTAAVTWAVLGGRSLENEATAVGALLHKGDLPSARLRLTHLVSRDTSSLDEAQVARAVVESVAENTSDAVVAPLFWGAVAGVPGLIGYRAANTLDAMVGYRSARYENFGWASARFDDLVNWPAARLGGLLVAVASPRTALRALAAWRRDASGHPSPNAGVVEASFAGALGICLGGTNRYGDRVEHRVVLGEGRAPDATDVPKANGLARRVGVLAAGVAAIAARKKSRK